MASTSKHRVAPAELADALLSEFVASTPTIAGKKLTLDEITRPRFDKKALICGIASVLLALAREEEGNPRFTAVRAELERRIFPVKPTRSGIVILDDVKRAMNDLSALLFPNGQPQEISWARNWLLDIGVDESNPVTLALLAMYWLDFHATASKALQSFEIG